MAARLNPVCSQDSCRPVKLYPVKLYPVKLYPVKPHPVQTKLAPYCRKIHPMMTIHNSRNPSHREQLDKLLLVARLGLVATRSSHRNYSNNRWVVGSFHNY